MKPIGTKDCYYLSVLALIGVLRGSRSTHLLRLAADTAGAMAYALSGRKRNRILRNLGHAWDGKLTFAKRRAIARGVFVATWREILEWSQCDASVPISEPATTVGMERLHNALAEGRGAILWESNGFGCRLAAKRLLRQEGVDLLQVHGTHNLGGFKTADSDGSWTRQRIVKRCFERYERALVGASVTIPPAGLSYLTRLRNHVRENGVVCIAGDGRLGQRKMRLNFLGRPQAFSTGMVHFARYTGAPILPFYCFRAGADGIRLVIERPLRPASKGDRDAVIQRTLKSYARQLEAYVKRHPSQYRNWHLLDTSPGGHGEGGPRP